MAWLAARPEQTLDPKIAQLFIGGCDDRHRDDALQMIARKQGGIVSIMSGLRDAESPELIAINCLSTGKPHDSVLLVTSQRSIKVELRNAKPYTVNLEHSDVIETKLLRGPSWMAVQIDTHASRFDFRPDDWRRSQHEIVFKVATPRVANLICQAIDSRL